MTIYHKSKLFLIKLKSIIKKIKFNISFFYNYKFISKLPYKVRVIEAKIYFKLKFLFGVKVTEYKLNNKLKLVKREDEPLYRLKTIDDRTILEDVYFDFDKLFPEDFEMIDRGEYFIFAQKIDANWYQPVFTIRQRINRITRVDKETLKVQSYDFDDVEYITARKEPIEIYKSKYIPPKKLYTKTWEVKLI